MAKRPPPGPSLAWFTASQWSATGIVAVVPANAVTGPVVVTVAGQSGTGPVFTVSVPPTVSTVSTTTGSAGTPVTISGSGFGAVQGTGAVWLGSNFGAVVSWSDTQVTATVAPNSSTGTVRVQQGGAWSNSQPFTVNTATISNVGPTSGVPGTQVTITGSNFGSSQGTGQVWLGTAPGTVQTWTDTQIVATVAAGSTTGNVQVLQNAVWSNPVPFTINTLYINGISPTSGTAGTQVTITGTAFGALQGSGTVMLGGAVSQIVSWSDTQVVAVVASSALTGVVRVQQNSSWSNAVAFTVPGIGAAAKLSPHLLNMAVGDTRTLQALSASGQPVTGLTWTSSDTTVVSLSTDDPPVLTAVAPGHVTVSAGGASADVTVWASLPLGTTLWSNPGDGSGVYNIVPAVPSQTGVADVFAFQGDGTVQAITADGTTAWTADVSSDYADIPDFQGGLVAMGYDSNGNGFIAKIDGMTGQRNWVYSLDSTAHFDPNPVPHPDGTIFAIRVNDYQTGPAFSLVGIDSATGSLKFNVPIQAQPAWPGVYGLQIAGDGYAYVAHGYADRPGQQIDHLFLMRVDTSGSFADIPILDTVGGVGDMDGPPSVNVITNADTGTALTWVGNDGNQYMALTSGTSVSVTAGPALPGQSFDVVAPVLQQADGSFIGTVHDDNGSPYMAAFGPAGNVLWSVAGNWQPQIATADGGVIAKQFDDYNNLVGTVTFDQNGNATGQASELAAQSWFGNSYQIGSVDQVLADAINLAIGYASFAKGHFSQNLASVLLNWFPPLARCTSSPGCVGPHDAIYNAAEDLISILSSSSLVPGTNKTVGSLAQDTIFGKLGTTTAAFVQYLSKHRPGFFDATKSTFCEDSLTSVAAQYFCAMPLLEGFAGTVQSYFSGARAPDAQTETPSTPLLTFFRPSSILLSSAGKNLWNEGVIFHEALHGFTGRYDTGYDGNDLMSRLGIPSSDPICTITTYIQKNVLMYSRLAGTAPGSCP